MLAFAGMLTPNRLVSKSLFMHSAVCLTTCPQPIPKQVLHRVRSGASPFNSQYPPFSLRSSKSYLLLLPRLRVTYILPFTFPSTACFRKPSKGKAVPLQAWSGPEGCRKLRFPDFMTMAQDGGKVVSFTHRPPLPPGNIPGTHFR